MNTFVTRSVDNNASVSQTQKKKNNNIRQHHENYSNMEISCTGDTDFVHGALYVVKNCQMNQRCPVNLNVICLLNIYI